MGRGKYLLRFIFVFLCISIGLVYYAIKSVIYENNNSLVLNKKNTIINLFFFIYMSFLFSITLLPETIVIELSESAIMDFAEPPRMLINLTPFASIYDTIKNSINLNTGLFIPLSNILGNIIIFIPMGIYVSFKKDMKFSLLAGLLLSISIEICQYLFVKSGLLTMRAVDIDDVILNFLGCYLGCLIFNKFKNIKKIKKEMI